MKLTKEQQFDRPGGVLIEVEIESSMLTVDIVSAKRRAILYSLMQDNGYDMPESEALALVSWESLEAFGITEPGRYIFAPWTARHLCGYQCD
jgi:hypothetical protein